MNAKAKRRIIARLVVLKDEMEDMYSVTSEEFAEAMQTYVIELQNEEEDE